jgi:hypothetical protein
VSEDEVIIMPASGYRSYSYAAAFKTSTGEVDGTFVAGTGASLSLRPDGKKLFYAYLAAGWFFEFPGIFSLDVTFHGTTPDVYWWPTGLFFEHGGKIWAASNTWAVTTSGALIRSLEGNNYPELQWTRQLDVAAPIADVFYDKFADEFWLADQTSARLFDGQYAALIATYGLSAKPLWIGRYGRITYVLLDDGRGGTRIEQIRYNHAPKAEAGSDRSLECTGDGGALVHLDGSASNDADRDALTYTWTVDDLPVASEKSADVSLGVGQHRVTLTVFDGDATSADSFDVTVRDSQAPAGSVTAPPANACVGPAALPVIVADNFSDGCSAISRSYVPAGGPSYSQHGDYLVTVTATDSGGNATSSVVPFTIDTTAPKTSVSADLKITSSDDDGARGEVVLERMFFDGCLLYDGATYGDADGLLSDETIVLDQAALCRASLICGVSRWKDPLVSVDASDCGGNGAAAKRTLPGTYGVKPGSCSR